MNNKQKSVKKGSGLNHAKMEDFKKPQQNYILKKQRVLELQEKVDERLANFDLDQIESEDKIEKFAEKIGEIEREEGLDEAKIDLRVAEEELVDWAFDKIKEEVDLEDCEDLRTLKENWRKYPRIKSKVIDVAMRYNPDKGGD